jgi:predicted dehydrogenase
MKIGIIGCGNISSIYLKNCTTLFKNLEVAAISDLVKERAESQAEEYGIKEILSTEELLARKDIKLVLNLTTPPLHTKINRMAIEAGKHVYAEKPAALNLDEAKETLKMAAAKGLLVGSAPDTFMGAGIQQCRKLIDDGIIGEVVSANAVMACHGHESWHPGPEFYYKQGGGPMLDMGPYYLTALVNLVGPIKAVSAMTRKTFDTRLITSEPLNGTVIDVETTTHLTGNLMFENGAIGTITTSFDIWKSDQPRIEIHGSLGTISCPDPNTFGGPVKLCRQGSKEWIDLPLFSHSHAQNSRGLGLSDMASAIEKGRKHRASGELSTHVLDVMLAFDRASETKTHVNMTTTCEKPAAMPVDITDGYID